MTRYRTAEKQAAYRARVKAGLQVPQPRPVELPPAVELTGEQRAELESLWLTEYRRCISGWLIRQRSEHTRRAYRRAWAGWIVWCEDHGIDPINPPMATGGVYLADLAAQGVKPASMAQYRAAIRQALIELATSGLRSGGDPFARVRPAYVGHDDRVILSDDDVAAIVAAARDLGGLHLTAVLLCAVCGLRSFEAGQVGVSSVVPTRDGPQARIVGKGGRPALVPLPDVVLRAARIDGWPADRRRAKNPANIIRWLCSQVAERSGVKFGPHSLRHWHVTAALEAGVPLEVVQEGVRHSDPRTTQRYDWGRRRASRFAGHVLARHRVLGSFAADGV